MGEILEFTNIPIDIVCREEFEVSKEHCAKTLGSGGINVLSTPSMILFMEHTAWKCVEEYLPNDYTTVGTHVCISHLKPAPIGAKILVEAKLTKIEGRKLVFEVSAHWNDIKIGEGIHERYIINKPKFLEKVKRLLEKKV